MELEELREKLRGVNVVMTTPFKADLQLDLEGLRKNTRFLIDNGLKTGYGVLIPSGSTGECFSLTQKERKQMMEIVVDEARGEVPVVVGCNHTDTRRVIELAKHAEEIGADGVMIVRPFYFAPSPELTYEHYKAMGDAIKIGIMIYNNAWIGASGDIPIDLLEKLTEIKNIVAIKDCTPYIRKHVETIRKLGQKISYISGTPESFAPYSLMMGSKGWISSIANFAPKVIVNLYKAAERRDMEEVEDIICRQINPYSDFAASIRASQNTAISAIKVAQNILGLAAGPVRLPLLPLTTEQKERLRNVLKDINLVP